MIVDERLQLWAIYFLVEDEFIFDGRAKVLLGVEATEVGRWWEHRVNDYSERVINHFWDQPFK